MTEDETTQLRALVNGPASLFGERPRVRTWLGGAVAGLPGGAVPATVLLTVDDRWTAANNPITYTGAAVNTRLR